MCRRRLGRRPRSPATVYGTVAFDLRLMFIYLFFPRVFIKRQTQLTNFKSHWEDVWGIVKNL